MSGAWTMASARGNSPRVRICAYEEEPEHGKGQDSKAAATVRSGFEHRVAWIGRVVADAHARSVLQPVVNGPVARKIAAPAVTNCQAIPFKIPARNRIGVPHFDVVHRSAINLRRLFETTLRHAPLGGGPRTGVSPFDKRVHRKD